MAIFTQLKQQLSEQFSSVKAQRGLVALQATISLEALPFSLLGWLKAQNRHFPHFFLQSRDADETLATVGAIRQFDSLEMAQQFIDQHDLPLIGGRQFEGNAHFILPQFAFAKNSQNLTACFYFDSDNFAEQAVVFQEFLADFEHVSTLDFPPNTLTSRCAASDFSQWKTNIERAVAAIRQGEFRKVVLANATTLRFDAPICAYSLLTESQKTNLGCYHFLWAESTDVAFVGSTPERLYQRQGRQFFTEALAGTAAVTTSEIQTELNAQWLLSDPKNLYENQLVVDDIESNLKDGVLAFEVDSAKIKRLHNVQHLRRLIHATLNDTMRDSDCLRRIHPTAAVAGLPRQAATQFIAENETFTRHWYAGTLGKMSREAAEFCVTLRSALIAHNTITLYAGAGIVEGSDPQSEWQEIKRKSQGIAKLLNIDLVSELASHES